MSSVSRYRVRKTKKHHTKTGGPDTAVTEVLETELVKTSIIKRKIASFREGQKSRIMLAMLNLDKS